jgi:ParB/RepB/Spo0J family partition protein
MSIADVLKRFEGANETMSEAAGVRKSMAGCQPAGQVLTIPVDRIEPDPDQPRKNAAANESALKGLGKTIRKHGQQQPVIVRYVAERDVYRLKIGERRWRAAKLEGIPSLMAVVEPPDADEDLLVRQLLENIQREDLCIVDKAETFRRMMELWNLSEAGLAEELGITPAAISKTMSVLRLPPPVLEKIRTGDLNYGEAVRVARTQHPKTGATRGRDNGGAGKRLGTRRTFGTSNSLTIVVTGRRKATDGEIAFGLREVAEMLEKANGERGAERAEAMRPAA